MQKLFHDSQAKYRAFVGGFGSGKTTALVYEALTLGLEYPGNRILIGRLTYPELESTTKMEFMEIVPPELIKNFRDTKNDLELVNGTKYFFRALDSKEKLKSLDLGAFAIDEATEIKEEVFYMLQSRLRYMKVPRRCGILSTNPNGHDWVWRLFVNKSTSEEDVIRAKSLGVDTELLRNLYAHFISPTADNTYLPDDYIDSMRASFSDAWVRRYIYSSFEEFEGLVFYGYDPKKNVYGNNERLFSSGESVQDRVIIAIDPGIDVTAVLFALYKFDTKEIFFFDEIYRERIGLEEVANMIRARLQHYKITHPTFLIDPSSKRQEQTSRTSVLKDLRKYQINCRTANNDIRLGILRLNELFKTGKLKIYKFLKNFSSEINSYYLDDKTGKPKANQRDHLMDVARYIANYLSPSEISNMSREEEQALLKTRRQGLRMFKNHRGKNMRNYLTPSR